MDSLDTVPAAEYASLITLTTPNDTSKKDIQFGTFDRNQNLKKNEQEHIYAQVTSNGHCHNLSSPAEVSKLNTTVDNKTIVLPNKKLMNNTILLKNPTIAFNHTNSVSDVRRPYPNLLSMCQNNYGSLNEAKESDKNLAPKTDLTTDSAVFSISGRRVVVSNGFNGNGNNTKQVNSSQDTAVNLPDIPNEWSSGRPTPNSKERTTKLQICTDCLSLCLFVPGTVLCILSPWLLVPIYIIPSFSGSHLRTLIWISFIGSAILVFMGCMVGNMVWYRRGNAWKCRLHFGKGPKDHYWGDGLTSKRIVHTI